MCQACKTMTDLILVGATSAGALANFVVKHTGSAEQNTEPAPPVHGEHDEPAQTRIAH